MRAKFDRAWGVPVPPKRGWHLSQMFEAMERGDLRALYVIGENPLQSEADRHHAQHLLESLDCLIVQDLFLTPTAELAHVVLPASAAWCESEGTVTNSERRVQRVRKAVDAPAGARDDLAILFDLARRLGRDWGRPEAETIWNELRGLSPMHAGMSYARLEKLGGLQWPCYDEEHPGELFLHSRLWEWPLRGPRVGFVPVEHDPPVDKLDDEFPLRLTTGRRLDEYNTGVQTSAYASPLRCGRNPRRVAGGRRAVRPARGRDRPRPLPARPARGAGAHGRRTPPGPDLHDDALPGRRHDEPAHHRRHRSQVRYGRVQGHRDSHRAARDLNRSTSRSSARPPTLPSAPRSTLSSPMARGATWSCPRCTPPRPAWGG